MWKLWKSTPFQWMPKSLIFFRYEKLHFIRNCIFNAMAYASVKLACFRIVPIRCCSPINRPGIVLKMCTKLKLKHTAPISSWWSRRVTFVFWDWFIDYFPAYPIAEILHLCNINLTDQYQITLNSHTRNKNYTAFRLQ